MSLEIGDAELLAKARNANGTGETFKKLYDEGSLVGKGSQSEADLQLCGMLAYWTGCDPNRMDRLFRNSKLMRPKWDEKRGESTYGKNTIALAISNCREIYDPNYEGKAPDTVQKFLAECEEWMMQQPWSGRGGGTDRKLYRAFLVLGRQYGTQHESGGVEVSASQRQLMETSHVGSKSSLRDGLTRLVLDKEVIEKLETGSGTTSSTYLIKLPQTSTSINNPQTTVLILVRL